MARRVVSRPGRKRDERHQAQATRRAAYPRFVTPVRMLSSLLIGVVLVYMLLLAAVYLNQHRLLYLPNVPARALVSTPAHYGLAYENVRLETQDNVSLHGWFVPVAEATRTVLFLHGNAGNISHRLDSLAIFVRLGWQVLIIDYRGYGESSGKPSEAGTYLDATAAWRYLTETRSIAGEHIVLFGRSLGGAVAVELATRVVAGALLVESSFTSVPEMAAKLYPFLPVRWLARLQYGSLNRIGRVQCPVLVLHSEDDEIIPFAHGRSLYQAAPDPKAFFAMHGGHNEGFLSSGDAYSQALGNFVNTHTREEPQV